MKAAYANVAHSATTAATMSSTCVTVEHLLTHRSGISHYIDLPGWFDGAYADVSSREAFLDAIATMLLNDAPGTRYRYSNANYYLLGLIIEGPRALPRGRPPGAHPRSARPARTLPGRDPRGGHGAELPPRRGGRLRPRPPRQRRAFHGHGLALRLRGGTSSCGRGASRRTR